MTNWAGTTNGWGRHGKADLLLFSLLRRMAWSHCIGRGICKLRHRKFFSLEILLKHIGHVERRIRRHRGVQRFILVLGRLVPNKNHLFLRVILWLRMIKLTFSGVTATEVNDGHSFAIYCEFVVSSIIMAALFSHLITIPLFLSLYWEIVCLPNGTLLHHASFSIHLL